MYTLVLASYSLLFPLCWQNSKGVNIVQFFYYKYTNLDAIFFLLDLVLQKNQLAKLVVMSPIML